jgi:hypothetical protein
VNNLDVAIGAVVVTVVLGLLNARRAAYDRVIRALDLVSEGEVAKARHRVGAVLYDYPNELAARVALPLMAEDHSSRIEDLFTILWAATRLNAVRRSIGPRIPGHRSTGFTRTPIWGARGPHKLLEQSAAGWVRFWMLRTRSGEADIPLIVAIAHTLGVQLDDDDTSGLKDLYVSWGDRPASVTAH